MPSRMTLESKALDEAEVIGMFFFFAGRTRGATLARFRLKRNPPDESSTLVGTFARGDLFDQFDDAAPELGVGDARERTGQRQALGGRQKIGNVGRRSSFGEAPGVRGAAGASLEQKRYRHLKYFGDLLDAACTDPVGALLVFLNLLEGEAQCFAELLLAHAQHDAAHAHTTADIFVNRVGLFDRHLQHSLGLHLVSMPQARMPSNLARKLRGG